MKTIILFAIICFCCSSLKAQDSTKVNPPKIVTKLKVGQSLSLGAKSMRFVEVSEDSRCPSDVTCVWEGEVKVAVALYEKEQLIEQKVVTFKGMGGNPNTKNIVFSTEDKNIYGYAISPYPKTSAPIDPKEYYLELIVK